MFKVLRRSLITHECHFVQAHRNVTKESGQKEKRKVDKSREGITLKSPVNIKQKENAFAIYIPGNSAV